MLIYGICMSEIKDSEIDWDKVEKLLESYDSSLHGDFKEYVNYDDSETPEEQEYWKKEWFLAYDSMGYHGLGAFLHDVSQLLGYRITEHAEMYGSVICST